MPIHRLVPFISLELVNFVLRKRKKVKKTSTPVDRGTFTPGEYSIMTMGGVSLDTNIKYLIKYQFRITLPSVTVYYDSNGLGLHIQQSEYSVCIIR